MSEEKQIEEMVFIIQENSPLSKISSEDVAESLYNAGYRKIPDNIGDFSDGYHTFNELYHHRAVLFSVICNTFPEKAWKSKLHDTGDMYEGMFIVGIETEQGQATYHYDIEPYWDMFKVKELEKAPKWDGHTPCEAIERIGNLSCEGYRKQSGWISVDERLPEDDLSEEHEKKTIKVLVAIKAKNGITIRTQERFRDYTYSNGGDPITFWTWRFSHGKVTHWMPLPSAPDMKGGE